MPSDETNIERRVRDLQAVVAEHIVAALKDPALERFSWLFCDGCGAKVAVDPDHPAVPQGWDLRGPDNDFCRHCVEQGK